MVTVMVENELTNEIVLNVPLRAAKRSSASRRADTAIEVLKEYVSRSTKVEQSKSWIDNRVNESVWAQGREKIKSKISVKVIKLQDGTAEVILP